MIGLAPKHDILLSVSYSSGVLHPRPQHLRAATEGRPYKRTVTEGCPYKCRGGYRENAISVVNYRA
jgi:hypothetical protein